MNAQSLLAYAGAAIFAAWTLWRGWDAFRRPPRGRGFAWSVVGGLVSAAGPAMVAAAFAFDLDNLLGTVLFSAIVYVVLAMAFTLGWWLWFALFARGYRT
ncbi:MAG: hypothetical protein FDZ75_09450 [Actinobacteria bacterium]|nr:MAG: hypothetical protein FDZ75_09450 [Actinomycetota bacterium]